MKKPFVKGGSPDPGGGLLCGAAFLKLYGLGSSGRVRPGAGRSPGIIHAGSSDQIASCKISRR